MKLKEETKNFLTSHIPIFSTIPIYILLKIVEDIYILNITVLFIYMSIFPIQGIVYLCREKVYFKGRYEKGKEKNLSGIICIAVGLINDLCIILDIYEV